MPALNAFVVDSNESDFIVNKEQPLSVKIDIQRQFYIRFGSSLISRHARSETDAVLSLWVLASDLGRNHTLTIHLDDTRQDKSTPHREWDALSRALINN